MTRVASRRSVLAGSAVGAVCGLAGCLSGGRDVEETITETHAADELSAIAVSTVVSDVDVHAASQGSIDIEGRKGAVSRDDLESIGLRTSTADGVLEVAVDRNDSRTLFGLRPDPILDLSLTVPEALEVCRIESGAGDVDVANVHGDLRIETETGNVTASAVDGTVSATTETGSVVVDDPASIDRLATVTGDVTASLPGIDGDAVIGTTTGGIDLRVPDELDLTLEITTETGEISVTGVDALPEMTGDSLIEAVVGDGTHRLEIVTETGDVAVTDRSE
ncbi:DUF4097 family beta strand repeat protein [Natronorubrum sp. JWXQ-INN-674]|uniref:DUF4097 family beta strand repeat protein n=1 Tax=Natronorubrum halalkaliphilum TaxID=2691917 RepID=A0A6B0VPV4_9EURY|nr:DUF4097 family beta strand repeat-containing protein [Natronorubrum halalkaliphilum]MXV63851.1 DUF4097 family beta strand repeat protein [Natronorubrum halalkaliphilum]